MLDVKATKTIKIMNIIKFNLKTKLFLNFFILVIWN